MTKNDKKTKGILTTLVAAMFVMVSMNARVFAQGTGHGGGGGGVSKPGFCVWTEEEEHDEELLVKLAVPASDEEPVVEEGVPTWRWRGSAGESEFNFPYTGDLRFHPQARSEWCLDQRTVTPAAVTFVDATCKALGTYTIPEFDGVEYFIDEEVVAAGTYEIKADTTIVVTAKVIKTYFLDEGAVTEWTHKFVTPTAASCVVATPPAVLGTTTTVAQVKATPVGAADAGGADTALIGLVVSTFALSLGAIVRKFSL